MPPSWDPSGKGGHHGFLANAGDQITIQLSQQSLEKRKCGSGSSYMTHSYLQGYSKTKMQDTKQEFDRCKWKPRHMQSAAIHTTDLQLSTMLPKEDSQSTWQNAHFISHNTAPARHTPLQHVMLKLQPVSTGCHAKELVLVTGVQWYEVSNPEAELLSI